MAHRALVEVLGDAASFIGSLRASGAATETFDAQLKTLSVNAKASADAQVAASVHKTERLRGEIVAYQAIGAAAERGSAQQIAAANLAARAQGQLARSTGVSALEARHLSAAAGNVERDIGRASRGALAGSGIFRAFGRSLAFASGGFLLFATGGQFVRSSVDAAREAGVTQRQLEAQFKASGRELSRYQGEIDKTTLRLSALSGFTKDQLDQSFTILFRNTGNVSKSLTLTALAADVARGRNMELSKASILVGKVAGGNVSILRRYGLEIGKHATATEGLALLTNKYAGQAAAAATEAQKFGAVLHDSEVIIGEGILPAINKELVVGAKWLQQMNESGRLQHDVAVGAHAVGVAIHGAVAVVHIAAGAIRTLDSITGSFSNTIKDLAAAWLVLKARSALIRWATIGSDIANVGALSTTAAGEVGGLRAALLGLGGPEVLLALAAAAAGVLLIQDELAHHTKGHAQTGGSAKLNTEIFEQGGKYYERVTVGRNVVTKEITKAQAGAVLHPGAAAAAATEGRDKRGAAADAAVAAAHAKVVSDAARGRTTSLQGQFNIDELKLADAQRTNNVKLQRAILVSEEAIVLKLRDQAKTLKDRTAFAQQAASIEGQIRSIDSSAVSAAKKEAAAAAKAKKLRESFTEPLALQLAQAKADAIASGTGAADLTKGQRAVLVAMRAAAKEALKSGRLAIQGQISALNEITSINNQLITQGAGDGFNLTAAEKRRRASERRASQRDRYRGEPAGAAVAGGGGRRTQTLHYSPTIISKDVREGEKMNERLFFRFRQRYPA